MKIGDVFGRWTVTTEPYKLVGLGNHKYVDAICTCGTVRAKVHVGSLQKGDSKSCGCLSKELLRSRNSLRATHGYSAHLLYRTWLNILSRCQNPKNLQYPGYGARGISICESWKTFEGFYSGVGDPPFEGATLDRINNDGNYCPGNIRWATRAEQNRNKRNITVYEFQGQLLTLPEISRIVGMDYGLLYKRVRNLGMSLHEATTTAIRPLNEGTYFSGRVVPLKRNHEPEGRLLYKPSI